MLYLKANKIWKSEYNILCVFIYTENLCDARYRYILHHSFTEKVI